MTEGQQYCSACGQRVISGRLTLHDIAHDLIHAFTHADRSIFTLIGALLRRPGHVAREYIGGKRRKYFGPFAFLVISVGVASFITYVAGVDWFRDLPRDSVRTFLARHFNLVILVQMPLLALVCTLLFRSAKLNFSEHLVLAAYTSGIRALFLALVETPVLVLFDLAASNRWISLGYLALWFSYFSVAAAQFYGGNRFWAGLRAWLAGILSVVLTMLLIYGIVFLVMTFGGR